MDAKAFVELEILRARLRPPPAGLPLVPERSDFDLNPAARPGPRPLIPSAVLIPIIARTAPTVLFTRRAAGLKRHAGQVSFPGGTADPSDASLIATALREAEEEVGLAPDFVTIAGCLAVYETVTGFAVLPVVGLVEPGFALRPDAREVEKVFEVPLAFLMDPANCRREGGDWNGRKRYTYAFSWQSHYIWGATAAIVVALSRQLR